MSPVIFEPFLIPQKDVERFFSRIDKTEECWIYTGCGKFWYKGKNWIISKFSYLVHFGPFDLDLFVCHDCDNPLCVRPDHLWLGTCADNTRNAAEKGRMPSGLKHGTHTKLESRVFGDKHWTRRIGWSEEGRKNLSLTRQKPTELEEEDIKEIRRLYDRGGSCAEIGEMFGVTRQTVRKIGIRLRYKYMEGSK